MKTIINVVIDLLQKQKEWYEQLPWKGQLHEQQGVVYEIRTIKTNTRIKCLVQVSYSEIIRVKKLYLNYLVDGNIGEKYFKF